MSNAVPWSAWCGVLFGGNMTLPEQMDRAVGFYHEGL